MEGSKAFLPTDAAAATEQKIGSDWRAPPGSGGWTIYKIRCGFGNVANAKENAGYVRVKIAKQSGDFYYVVGAGCGAATISSGVAAEEIDCSIPMDNNALVQVYGYNAEAVKDFSISIQYRSGMGRKTLTYKCGGAGSDMTAGSELTIGTMTVDQGQGTMWEIRFTGSGVANAKAETAKLILEIPGNPLSPYEYSVGHGVGGNATGMHGYADVIKLKYGIPLKDGVVITAKIINDSTDGGNLLSCGVSIQVA